MQDTEPFTREAAGSANQARQLWRTLAPTFLSRASALQLMSLRSLRKTSRSLLTACIASRLLGMGSWALCSGNGVPYLQRALHGPRRVCLAGNAGRSPFGTCIMLSNHCLLNKPSTWAALQLRRRYGKCDGSQGAQCKRSGISPHLKHSKTSPQIGHIQCLRAYTYRLRDTVAPQ